MNLDIKARITGEYTFELRDGATGELKQTVKCHNIITDMVARYFCYGSSTAYSQFVGLRFGSGSGTPSTSDTALFTQLWTVNRTSRVLEVVDRDTVRCNMRIDVPATASYVGTITEVGADGYYYSNNFLASHAILVDAEGNPISITKTQDDALIVTAVFTLNASMSLGNYTVKYPPYIDYSTCQATMAYRLAQAVFTGETYGGIYVSFTNDILAEYDLWSTSPSRLSPTTALGTVTYSGNLRVAATTGDTGFYRYMQIHLAGLPVVEYFDLTKANGEWSGLSVTGATVGTGDGTVQDFTLPFGRIEANSETIYVNGVAQTRGTHYTIDHKANPNYLTELSEVDLDTTIAGALNEKPASDVMTYPQCSRLKNSHQSGGATSGLDFTKRCMYFSPDYPMVITFPEARAINRLRGWLNYRRASALKVAYSTDGETYTQVATQALTASQSERADNIDLSWTEVTAKYWRISVDTTYASGTLQYACFRQYNSSSYHDFFFGHSTQYGIHFLQAPVANAVVTMDCALDLPYKSSNYAFNVAANFTLRFN